MKTVIVLISLIISTSALAGIDNMRMARNQPEKKTEIVKTQKESKPIYDKRYENWKRNESLNKASQKGTDRYIIRNDKQMR